MDLRKWSIDAGQKLLALVMIMLFFHYFGVLVVYF
jgi:hypothetical protein